MHHSCGRCGAEGGRGTSRGTCCEASPSPPVKIVCFPKHLRARHLPAVPEAPPTSVSFSATALPSKRPTEICAACPPIKKQKAASETKGIMKCMKQAHDLLTEGILDRATYDQIISGLKKSWSRTGYLFRLQVCAKKKLS